MDEVATTSATMAMLRKIQALFISVSLVYLLCVAQFACLA
jgi:exosortase/archaeosortase